MTLLSPATTAWTSERGRLLGIAYRMLGDFGHAEDVVSEVAIEALRQEQTAEREVRSWPALLTTICVRRSIDRLRAQIAVREDYTGHWLPEPVAVERLPEDAAADRELLSFALLHLAEQLAPEARAAVVLHRAFGMAAGEIGEILERSPAAVRQLISRAERRLRLEEGVRATRAPARAMLEQLVAAVEGGDIEGVVAMLRDDAILWADGGGVVSSALNPLFGPEKIARFLHGVLEIARTYDPERPLQVSVIEANGEAALMLHYGGRATFTTFELDDAGMILGIRQVANPAKLQRIAMS
ncbi:sigma-70 family RNA polymerase sigma factor [Streptomyces sp. AC495_CC817]|uniref:sigma-70 family RNA polymerase sigma factor n=1 Tax=Streptomyces sp. AC495_CC817 TaxID=2823900 RepID=UPI001C25543A|nr:sigma-70 family RNA polymerase sigma factor [Streptomyces sp. AC495_CC817]